MIVEASLRFRFSFFMDRLRQIRILFQQANDRTDLHVMEHKLKRRRRMWKLYQGGGEYTPKI